MASPAKKGQKPNFSPSEIAVLTEKFEENMEILQSKFTNSVTNAKKIRIWEEIAAAVNSVGVTRRTTQEVREKWKNLQSNAKKEYSFFKAGQRKTGGGPAPPSPSEASLKIMNMFGDQPSFTGLQGFETGMLIESACQCSNLAKKLTLRVRNESQSEGKILDCKNCGRWTFLYCFCFLFLLLQWPVEKCLCEHINFE